ncbi:GGDEF domain-containing protein, partial [Candidatus Woesearchaeota archaeon]|nr:GGDEF domain-containing protein [Candidatus Woesearchaeota archaeon]
PITLADIQQDMRSFTTPDEVAQYALKLLRYSASVDPAALETLSRYGLQSQYRSNLLRELTDAFTGIANKKHFNREIVRKLQAAEEAQKPLSLILFDIDKFKPVNDTYGHAVGDVVLKSLVGVVRTHIKQADFFARIGGEEFAIIVFGGHDVVAGLAERLRTQVAETMRKVVAEYHITDRPTVTISLGTATYNGRGERLGNTEATHAAEALIGIADKAQYLSKVNRNTLTIGAEVTARELIH